MLTSVDISNYRGFKTYRMEPLARVNLFVGKNNSGKTAFLEAIHLVASSGDPWVLAEAAQRRGEMIHARDGRPRYPELTHFFSGHELTLDASFSVRADNGSPGVTVRLAVLEDSQLELFGVGAVVRPAFRAVFEGAGTAWASQKGVPVSEQGGLMFESRQRIRDGAAPDMSDSRPSVFIPPDSTSLRQLADMWRQVILDGRKEVVIDALKIIQPDLLQIEFLPIDYYVTRATNAPLGIVVKIASHPRPLPLGSMGDGMRRLLALAIAFSRAGGGILLVDEVDTGLHYSVMADMWKLVIETAVHNDIQVFATTHSWDCVDGLRVLCKRDPSLMANVAVHKIDSNIDHSVSFQGEDFVRAVEGGVELR